MSDDNSTRAGLLSGLFAVIMVVALSVMALSALQPEQETSANRADFGAAASDTVSVSASSHNPS